MPQRIMAPSTNTELELKVTHALNAYGKDGQVVAQSWDSGKTWKQVGEPENPVQPRRNFTRKIMALIEEPTPRIAHRILTPFSVLDKANVLTGWAPYDAMMQLNEGSLDSIIIPNLLDPIRVQELKRIGRTVIMDIDAPVKWNREEQEILRTMLTLVDGVLVANELIASKVRPYHSHVFVVQHLLRQGLWAGFTPRKHLPVQVGIPYDLSDDEQYAIDLLSEKHKGRVEWTKFDWASLDPLNEVVTYRELDIVLLPPLPDRVQRSYAPLLGAQAACCAVVGDRHYPGLVHRQTGITLAKTDARTLVMELNSIISDTSGRARIGRVSRSQAMRMTAENKQSQIFMPYRVLVPESEPVQIVEE